MCRVLTPKSKQIACARCKTGIVNPDDGWEHGMMAGKISLSLHSRIYDYVIAGKGFEPRRNNERTAVKHPAVKKVHAQKMDLEFGLHPAIATSGSCGEPNGKYPLCESCHKTLLRVIGEFFFAPPAHLDAFVLLKKDTQESST